MPDSLEIKREAEQTTRDFHIMSAFHKSVEEGHVRLERSWSNLFATGLVGGIDVSLGVLALLVIEEATGSKLLSALGFSIGFIALTLAQSELFTENFLISVIAVVARRSGSLALLRLWAGTAVMNLIGGWVFTWLIINALPRLRGAAIDSAQFYLDLSIPKAFTLGVIGGAAITLMT